MSQTYSGAADRVAQSFETAIAGRRAFDYPYRHYLLENVFPEDIAEELHARYPEPVRGGPLGVDIIREDRDRR